MESQTPEWRIIAGSPPPPRNIEVPRPAPEMPIEVAPPPPRNIQEPRPAPEEPVAASPPPPRNIQEPRPAPEKPIAASPPPPNDGEGAPPAKKPGRGKWKPALAAVLVLALGWEVVHVVMKSAGKTTSSASGTRSHPAAHKVSPSPTPTRRVSLGGHSLVAGGQPIILLNPGLVAPGGQVSVQGSGFDPGSTVDVRVRGPRSGPGTEVAVGKTNKTGSLVTEFTMPASMNGSGTTVVAQESGSSKSATAQLVSPGGDASVTIDGKDAGQPGDTVSLSASGFGPGETVHVFWGRMTGTPAATLTADGSGSLSRVSVPVGLAPVGPTTLVLVGTKTHATATAPYQMLGLYPNTTPHPYAVQAGKLLTYSGTGFAPGEQVLVYFNSSGGAPALSVQASSNGGFSTSFNVPFGLSGRQTLIAIGAQSRAAVSTGFTVLPYAPTVQASTYGALPGTSISFYAGGFASNEVVLVYGSSSRSSRGSLVTAFRVNDKGAAVAAGSYTIASNSGPILYFTLVGQKSGGSGVAKVSVTASPSGAAAIPPPPAYVLPPSLGGKPAPKPSATQSAKKAQS